MIHRWVHIWILISQNGNKTYAYHSGLERWLYLSLLQRDPVYFVQKEGVSFDRFFAPLWGHAAQTLVRILGHELCEKNWPLIWAVKTRRKIQNKHTPLRIEMASLVSQTGYNTSSWRMDSNKSSSLSASKGGWPSKVELEI